jgi:hypothetical protein
MNMTSARPVPAPRLRLLEERPDDDEEVAADDDDAEVTGYAESTKLTSCLSLALLPDDDDDDDCGILFSAAEGAGAVPGTKTSFNCPSGAKLITLFCEFGVDGLPRSDW